MAADVDIARLGLRRKLLRETMSHTIDLRIFQLLTARLCHDLVGPIGAASNGAELLTELGTEDAGDAVGLIADSAGKATDRLRYYRVAYGLATGVLKSIDDAQAFATAMFADQRFAQEWRVTPSGQASLGDGAGKLLLNMLLLAAEAMGREGMLTITIEAGEQGTHIEILARGEGAELDAETIAGLRADAPIDALTPRSVQGHFTARFAEFLGSALTVDPQDQAVRLSCTVSSAN